MKVALRFVEVSKRFGRRTALDRLSFSLPVGSLTGFVGHNGAGKTTAFSVVAGYLQPDGGLVDVLGRGPFDPRQMKGLLGVLPQDAELPDRHTPRELLVHLARLQGLDGGAAKRESARVLDAVLLVDRADDRIGTLSHGMRRRVSIATTLVGSPPLILLDEPMSGLDPAQARAIRERLAELRGTSTLVVSSHDLADLERISDWVVMMRDGRCLQEGPLAEVTRRTSLIVWELGPGEPPLAELRAALPDHHFRLADAELIQEAPAGALDSSSVVVMTLLAGARIPLRAVRRGVALEDRFLADLGAAPSARGGTG